MATALIVPPGSEPVSLAEAKRHLHVEHADEDAWLADCIAAARVHVEHACGRKLVAQTWRQYAEGREVRLEVGPVREIADVTVYDREGDPRVLSPAEWSLDDECLVIDSGIDLANGVEIDVEAGMAETPVDLASTLKRAVLLLVAHWFEFRGYVAPADQPVALPPGFDALVAPFRRVRL